ncbi:probable serine/threonine-protein kinase DDB_G0282963 isoform X2 [Condylostylus longicornis]|uniref:probable serine/threonine-protein kinase DDB_G0282963 isoform X1 n=1 Tax=Condylostylus longicornis TaxID=2530218 RepID=UPI00244DCB90|nr:probable serine/threonine-protein kinase DDB_G0282963 isoform X1 [Condylostylus longicornis]XP_055372700.1 probable serine/threonine-protein kinase DDB_G0282963 isoform X2 [Condylostylus longicornis]XP_055372701.1 probable serine/threonine-protein kinase DDB_G0282963 isoform X2 [Condylostylus longicornis]
MDDSDSGIGSNCSFSTYNYSSTNVTPSPTSTSNFLNFRHNQSPSPLSLSSSSSTLSLSSTTGAGAVGSVSNLQQRTTSLTPMSSSNDDRFIAAGSRNLNIGPSITTNSNLLLNNHNNNNNNNNINLNKNTNLYNNNNDLRITSNSLIGRDNNIINRSKQSITSSSSSSAISGVGGGIGISGGSVINSIQSKSVINNNSNISGLTRDEVKIWRDPQANESLIRHIHSNQHHPLYLPPVNIGGIGTPAAAAAAVGIPTAVPPIASVAMPLHTDSGLPPPPPAHHTTNTTGSYGNSSGGVNNTNTSGYIPPPIFNDHWSSTKQYPHQHQHPAAPPGVLHHSRDYLDEKHYSRLYASHHGLEIGNSLQHQHHK